jgi:hypothetical protein
MPLRATGERTDLNRGHRPRSYQVTLDGLGTAAATQRWTVSPRATFGIESAAAARVCASYRTLPPDEDDIEFGNDP